MSVDILATLEQDRANLVSGLEQMQVQYEQLGRRIQQQAGALQYAELVIARVKGEQNGATPGVETAPQDGELD